MHAHACLPRARKCRVAMRRCVNSSMQQVRSMESAAGSHAHPNRQQPAVSSIVLSSRKPSAPAMWSGVPFVCVPAASQRTVKRASLDRGATRRHQHHHLRPCDGVGHHPSDVATFRSRCCWRRVVHSTASADLAPARRVRRRTMRTPASSSILAAASSTSRGQTSSCERVV